MSVKPLLRHSWASSCATVTPASMRVADQLGQAEPNSPGRSAYTTGSSCSSWKARAATTVATLYQKARGSGGMAPAMARMAMKARELQMAAMMARPIPAS